MHRSLNPYGCASPDEIATVLTKVAAALLDHGRQLALPEHLIPATSDREVAVDVTLTRRHGPS